MLEKANQNKRNVSVEWSSITTDTPHSRLDQTDNSGVLYIGQEVQFLVF